ncbi:MAG: UTP--glucose-1-phosphate uridylyltransferase, partial [Firmicutes bacterium]|nr:UTP--glucose-1-phosphate uridylyltransferase [Bacillota bacterium]
MNKGKVKKAVVLCGGLASRFLPISKAVAKEMLPILDKPIIHIIVEELKKAGIEEVLIILGRGKSAMEEYFDKNPEIETRLEKTNHTSLLEKTKETYNLLPIYFLRQIDARGTGYAFSLAKKWCDEEAVLMTFGDEVVFHKDNQPNIYQQTIDVFSKTNKNVLAVSAVKKEDVIKYGIIKPGQSIEVLGIVEKPTKETAPSNLSFIGTAVLKPEVFDVLEKIIKDDITKLEYGITDAIDILAKKNQVVAKRILGKRFDTGSPLGLVKANIYAAMQDSKYKKELKEFLRM